jgi:hypothetical protein
MHFDPGDPPSFFLLVPMRVRLALSALLERRAQASLDSSVQQFGHIQGGVGWPAGETESLQTSAHLKDPTSPITHRKVHQLLLYSSMREVAGS